MTLPPSPPSAGAMSAPGATAADAPPRSRHRSASSREAGSSSIIAASCVIMSFASPHFSTWGNVRAMSLSFSIEGIVVVGMTFSVIVGGIDSSVGSVVCSAMVVTGKSFSMGSDPWTAGLAAIAASAAIGASIGGCVTRIGSSH
ncbi:hypothetical protein OY671_012702, partial [Metschnikowia pulcherrima]